MALRQPPPIIICDVDGEETDVERWSITDPDGRIVDLDLCEKHGVPLVRLSKKGAVRPTPEQQKATRSLDARVRGLPPLH